MTEVLKVVSVHPETGVLGSMTAGTSDGGWFNTHRKDRIEEGVFIEYPPGEWVQPAMGKLFCFMAAGDAYEEYEKELKRGTAQLWRCEAEGVGRIYSTSRWLSDAEDFWIGCGSSYRFPRSNDPEGGYWHNLRGIAEKLRAAPDGSYVCNSIKLVRKIK